MLSTPKEGTVSNDAKNRTFIPRNPILLVKAPVSCLLLKTLKNTKSNYEGPCTKTLVL